MIRLAKAHGLGNDFLLMDAAETAAERPGLARRLCQRHVGVGADGLIVYVLTPDGVRMQLFNADGGEAEISGNGLRCLAAHVVARGWRPAAHVVTTAAGPRRVEVQPQDGGRYRVTTDLGRPILGSAEIPVALDPPRDGVIDHPVEAAGHAARITATSLGNPHCAVFVDEPPPDALLTRLGAALERHPLFPRRTNVEFICVTGRDALRVRFWERGVGLTSASGTGAASAAVAAILNGRTDRRVRVVCDGGVLEVEWPEGGSVRQVGDVEILFAAEWQASPAP